MNAPRISIIVPVYNTAAYLPACIDSIRAQTYQNLEVLLIDDGSTDTSPQLCDEAARQDPHIQVVHQKNGGLSAARNSGLARCTGDYLTFVDSDDFLHERYVEALLAPCQEQGCEASIGMFTRVPASEDDRPLRSTPLSGAPAEVVTGRETNLRLYTAKYWTRTTTAWNKLFRRDLWGDARFPDIVLHEDEALLYQVLYRAQKVAYVDETLYFYRINSTGLMANRCREKNLTMLAILDERQKFYEAQNEPVLLTRTRNREFFCAVEYYQIVSRQPQPNRALLRRYRRRMRELYSLLLRSDYPLKRKFFYTLALCCPQRFTRMYCMKE